MRLIITKRNAAARSSGWVGCSAHERNQTNSRLCANKKGASRLTVALEKTRGVREIFRSRSQGFLAVRPVRSGKAEKASAPRERSEKNICSRIIGYVEDARSPRGRAPDVLDFSIFHANKDDEWPAQSANEFRGADKNEKNSNGGVLPGASWGKWRDIPGQNAPRGSAPPGNRRRRRRRHRRRDTFVVPAGRAPAPLITRAQPRVCFFKVVDFSTSADLQTDFFHQQPSPRPPPRLWLPAT